MADGPPFLRLGPATLASPVLFSVPHAGRQYPRAFQTLSRVPQTKIRALEDRYADLLIPGGVAALIAQTARVWVDLNRSEREFDPALVTSGHALMPVASAKVRGGLGVVPRKLARVGEIWRGPISQMHFLERIERHHRPYHEALSTLIDQAVARFGVAVLIDLHSMPTIEREQAPRFVVGDLFGRAAQGRFSELAQEILGKGGMSVTLNSPYAGGHILERHAKPHRNVHALQIEVDRALYLDEALEVQGPGIAPVRQRLAQLASALAEEALANPLPLAAE